jgi:hypothetical protein
MRRVLVVLAISVLLGACGGGGGGTATQGRSLRDDGPEKGIGDSNGPGPHVIWPGLHWAVFVPS